MHEDVTFEPLEPTAQEPAGPPDLRRLRDVTVEVAVEIGRTSMTIGETLSLRPGAIITLDRLAGEPVDMLVNGRRIGRGEVVVVDDEFGVRVTDVSPTDALPGA